MLLEKIHNKMSRISLPSEHSLTIVKTVSINASIQHAWDALTIPHLMKRWMFDSDITIESEMKTGKPFIIRGLLNNKPFLNKGTIEVFEPCRTFQYSSLSSLSDLEDKPENYSVLTFHLKEEDHTTVLTFTQRNFPGEASYEHSNFYWGAALFMLKKFTENNFNQ